MKKKTNTEILKDVEEILTQVRELVEEHLDDAGDGETSPNAFFLIEAALEMTKTYSEDK